MQSDYNIANGLIKFKNGKIELQGQEIEHLMQIIAELHYKVKNSMLEAEKKYEQLEKYFQVVITRMNKKLNKVSQLF